VFGTYKLAEVMVLPHLNVSRYSHPLNEQLFLQNQTPLCMIFLCWVSRVEYIRRFVMTKIAIIGAIVCHNYFLSFQESPNESLFIQNIEYTQHFGRTLQNILDRIQRIDVIMRRILEGRVGW